MEAVDDFLIGNVKVDRKQEFIKGKNQ